MTAQPSGHGSINKAFPSEVVTGSREENASKTKNNQSRLPIPGRRLWLVKTRCRLDHEKIVTQKAIGRAVSLAGSSEGEQRCANGSNMLTATTSRWWCRAWS